MSRNRIGKCKECDIALHTNDIISSESAVCPLCGTVNTVWEVDCDLDGIEYLFDNSHRVY